MPVELKAYVDVQATDAIFYYISFLKLSYFMLPKGYLGTDLPPKERYPQVDPRAKGAKPLRWSLEGSWRTCN